MYIMYPAIHSANTHSTNGKPIVLKYKQGKQASIVSYQTVLL